MENIVLFLSGSSVVAALLIGWLKRYIKEYVVSRFGDLGIVILLGLISFLLALGCWGWQFIPAEVLTSMGIIFGGAVLIFQVLWKAVIQKAIRGKLDVDEK